MARLLHCRNGGVAYFACYCTHEKMVHPLSTVTSDESILKKGRWRYQIGIWYQQNTIKGGGFESLQDIGVICASVVERMSWCLADIFLHNTLSNDVLCRIQFLRRSYFSFWNCAINARVGMAVKRLLNKNVDKNGNIWRHFGLALALFSCLIFMLSCGKE